MRKIINWLILLFLILCIVSLLANLTVDRFNSGHAFFIVCIGGLIYWLYRRIEEDGFPEGFGFHPRKYYDAVKPKELKALPIPSDAHDVLECFCRYMNMLDSSIEQDYAYSNEGEAMLLGGIDKSGNGYAYFSFRKDFPVKKVLNGLGFAVPIGDGDGTPGWSIGGYENTRVYLNVDNVKGYRDWCGYDHIKQFGSDACSAGWKDAIRATINNEWPRANITSCVVRVNDNPALLSYDVRIKT